MPATPRRTFGAVATPSPQRATRYLHDLQYHRLPKTWEPVTCGVLDDILQDDLLRGQYKSVTPRRYVPPFSVYRSLALTSRLVLVRSPAGQKLLAKARCMFPTGPQYVPAWILSEWSILESVRVISRRPRYSSSVMSCFAFVAAGNKINPARLSPCDVLTRAVPGVSNRFHLYTLERLPAICVSAVMITESCLLAPPVKGLQHLRVAGRYHSQDWELVVSFTCGAFRQPVLAAQLYKDAMQFSTRTAETSGGAKSDGTPKKRSPAIVSASTTAAAPAPAEPYTRRMEDPGMLIISVHCSVSDSSYSSCLRLPWFRD